MGVVPTLFGKVTKQWLLLGYACCLDMLPAFTAACGNSAPSLSSESNQLTLKWEKMTTSSDKITTTRLESYRSLEYSCKVMSKFFL